MSDLRIGRVAALAGVSVDTVRFYERRGLLPRATRERSGYRVFGESAVERLRLIRSLADLGIGLDEIDAMLRALGAPDAECSRERSRFTDALVRTDARIAEMEATREKLRAAVARCNAGTCDLVPRARHVERR